MLLSDYLTGAAPGRHLVLGLPTHQPPPPFPARRRIDVSRQRGLGLGSGLGLARQPQPLTPTPTPNPNPNPNPNPIGVSRPHDDYRVGVGRASHAHEWHLAPDGGRHGGGRPYLR